MHAGTRYNDQFLKYPLAGLNSYGHGTFNYVAPTAWNKLPYCTFNAPSVMSYRKRFKPHYFKISPKPAEGGVLSGSKVY